MNYPTNMMYCNMPHSMPCTVTMPMQVSCVDPCVVDALKSLMGKKVVIETTRGSLHGTVCDVKPDHVVIGESYRNAHFFVRIAQIVHIMPIVNEKC